MQIIESKQHFDLVKQLLEKAFNESMDPSDPDFQSLDEWFDTTELLSNPDVHLLQAIDNNRLVGIVSYSKGNPLFWPDGNKAELLVLAVDPGYQGRGAGKQLILEAIKKCKELGAKSIVFNAHSSLTKLHKYYESLGFVIIGELKNYFDNGNATFFKMDLD